jgi:hypothetical protein
MSMKKITMVFALAALIGISTPSVAQTTDNGTPTTQTSDNDDDSGKWGLAGLLGLLGLIGLKGKDKDNHRNTTTNR